MSRASPNTRDSSVKAETDEAALSMPTSLAYPSGHAGGSRIDASGGITVVATFVGASYARRDDP
jgi:hypothetical protein